MRYRDRLLASPLPVGPVGRLKEQRTTWKDGFCTRSRSSSRTNRGGRKGGGGCRSTPPSLQVLETFVIFNTDCDFSLNFPTHSVRARFPMLPSSMPILLVLFFAEELIKTIEFRVRSSGSNPVERNLYVRRGQFSTVACVHRWISVQDTGVAGVTVS